jgi:tRNA-2-methylthio-N6-dimethylallyladenosine synthase
MNVYDSQRIREIFSEDGITQSASLEDADIIVMNTCNIREKANDKVYSELGTLENWKAEKIHAGRTPLVVVAGCVAQAEGHEIIRRQSAVDIVVGPQAYQNLPDLISQATAGRRVVATDFSTSEKFERLTQLDRHPRPGHAPVSAFLTIQEGCDKFCTFCVVPYTRGAETCRSPQSILAEAEGLVARGTREIVLLGQNVNAYSAAEGSAECDLATLLERLALISGLDRIRYTTSHPREMSAALIAAHRDNPKLMPNIHLPVQSGSDAVLRAMNRQHTSDDYRRLVDRIRSARPDISLSTDIIVGFPGETDADFTATCDLVRNIGFTNAYTFKYSIRAGTPSADAAGQVTETEKHARLLSLQRLVDAQRLGQAERCVGMTFPVLFEKVGRNHGQIIGRTPQFHSVNTSGPTDLIGQVRDVRISRAGANSLSGTLIEPRISTSSEAIHP